jgi:hypothetical protein
VKCIAHHRVQSPPQSTFVATQQPSQLPLQTAVSPRVDPGVRVTDAGSVRTSCMQVGQQVPLEILTKEHPVCHPVSATRTSLADFAHEQNGGQRTVTVIAHYFSGCTPGRDDAPLFNRMAEVYLSLGKPVAFVTSLKNGVNDAICESWANLGMGGDTPIADTYAPTLHARLLAEEAVCSGAQWRCIRQRMLSHTSAPVVAYVSAICRIRQRHLSHTSAPFVAYVSACCRLRRSTVCILNATSPLPT